MAADVLVKATAYITRGGAGRRQLLVFTDPAYPDLGLIVPGGTCEPGESVESCLRREVAEEAGLTLAHFVRLATSARYVGRAGRPVLRHYFRCALAAPERVPDRFTHVVTGEGGDRGARVDYSWVALEPEPPVLDDRLGYGLEALLRAR